MTLNIWKTWTLRRSKFTANSNWHPRIIAFWADAASYI